MYKFVHNLYLHKYVNTYVRKVHKHLVCRLRGLWTDAMPSPEAVWRAPTTKGRLEFVATPVVHIV